MIYKQKNKDILNTNFERQCLFIIYPHLITVTNLFYVFIYIRLNPSVLTLSVALSVRSLVMLPMNVVSWN